VRSICLDILRSEVDVTRGFTFRNSGRKFTGVLVMAVVRELVCWQVVLRTASVHVQRMAAAVLLFCVWPL
jgi:hypothetical protein